MSIAASPIVNPANGHTYYLLSPSTWVDAESEAIGLGGHLATIDDLAENNWVFDTFTRPGQYGLWIGLNHPGSFQGPFVWSSGEPVSFTNWGPGQPDGFVQADGLPQDVVEITVEEGGQPSPRTEKWTDSRDTTLEYITSGGVNQGVVEVNTPDLATTSLTCDTTQGGVDYAYTISGSNPTRSTTAALYWSTDPSFSTGQHSPIPNSVIPTATKAQTDPYTGHYDASTIGTPPTDAAYKYLLFVVNPDDAVTESDGPIAKDSNNVKSLVLPDIVMLSSRLAAPDSVAFDYATTGDPGPFTVGLYRSADGKSFDPSALITSQIVTPGSPDFQGSGSFASLSQPLAGDILDPYLLVVANPIM